MPKCKIKNCKNYTRYKNTKEIYCSMHKARIKRHGYPELKRDAYQCLEKLPHKVVDEFILKNHKNMIDKEILRELKEKGIKNANLCNIKYRRRKLGIKKYLCGEIKKHKAWIRTRAIKKYGNECELCGYKISIETHHIIPKKDGGKHKIDNLMVLCPNCHVLVTGNKINLKTRKDIGRARKQVSNLLNNFL